ncbi:MAG: amino acid adenylation domain-containing protein [Candidatus Omnitrophota bacterium]
MSNQNTATFDKLRIAAGKKIKEKEYWLDKLFGNPPRSNLSSLYSPRIDRSIDEMEFAFTGEVNKGIIKLAAGSDIRLHMVLTAVFILLLNKYTGHDDVITGIPIVKTDNQLHADLINKALILRHQFTADMTFKDLLLHVRQTMIDADAHRNYPVELLLEQFDITVDTAILLENIHDMDDLSSLQPGMIFSFLRTSSGLHGKVQYDASSHRRNQVERMISYFGFLLECVLFNPEMKIKDMERVLPEEKERLLFEFNDTACDVPRDQTIPDLFKEQVERTPDRMALMGSGLQLSQLLQLSYREMDERSDSLSWSLREKGVGPDTVVGIKIERSVEMIIGIFGILKAGGAYLPIDPAYPQERIDYMLKDSGASVLITDKILNECRRGAPACAPGQTHRSAPTGNFSNDRIGQTRGSAPTSLAYVIYTSGSTGTPKGVAVPIRGFINLLHWYIDEFKLGENDNLLLIAPVSFDLCQKNLFSSFLSGGKLTLAPPGIPNYDVLSKIIRNESITLINCAPGVFYPLVDVNGNSDFVKLTSLRWIILGGEPIQVDKLLSWVNSSNYHGEIVNTYGPTECTDIATFSRMSREALQRRDVIPIGKPIPNVKTFICDRNDHLVPVMVSGELFICGIGVSRGYLNRPEFTAEKFFSVSSVSSVAKKYYKTGDLVRWLDDGNIEFLGRIDRQVKVRGLRIELGEIEACILKHEGIKDVVVAARKDDNGESYLCAYVIPFRNSVNITEIKNECSRSLPSYMIPPYFVQLDQFPLNFHGKIDFNALPVPAPSSNENAYDAPENKTEETLVNVWKDVLGIEGTIGVTDNFFERGGHSLKATVLVSRIYSVFHVNVPLSEVFENPTIRGLARTINQAQEGLYESITPVEEKEYYPVSSAQKRLYFLQQMDVNSTAYNIPGCIYLKEDVSVERLETVFRELIRRHESLRTSFHMINNEPVQRIHDDVTFNFLATEDTEFTEGGGKKKLRSLEGKKVREIENFVKCFDLTKAPLISVGLLKTDEGCYLLVDMHHIITDGVSHEILLKDFRVIYNYNYNFNNNDCNHTEELSPLRLQYKDYAAWQRSDTERERLKSREAYWLNELAGEIPVLNIPTDYPRPAIQSFEGSTFDFDLNRENSQGLRSIAKTQNVTLFMLLLAVFNVLLSKLSGQDDIIIGSPVAGRRHSDLEKIIGMFVNMLVLRHAPAGEKTFVEFLNELKESTLNAFENQEYPFEELVENVDVKRDTSRNPLFDVSFALQTLSREQISEPSVTPEIKTTKFDLALHCLEMVEQDQLHFTFQYSTRIFKKETIERFACYFKQAVAFIIRYPDSKIMDIDIMPEEEKEQLIFAFNDTDCSWPNTKTIHELFEEQVEKGGDRIAVAGVGNSSVGAFRETPLQINDHPLNQHNFGYLTYRQVNEESNRIASVLRSKGIQSDSIVALMMERSVEMIPAMLGVLKAGGAYLPIDPTYPKERIDYMLKDIGSELFITGEFVQEFRRGASMVAPGVLSGQVEMGQIHGSAPTGNSPNDRIGQTRGSAPTDLVYVIYTSGSTGRPKGVMLEHRHVVRLLFNDKFQFEFTNRDAWTMFHSYCFDFSVWEMYGALLYGGNLVIVPRIAAVDPAQLLHLLKKECVTVFNQTPTVFYNVIDEEMKHPDRALGIRYIIFGGEALDPAKLKEWRTRYPNTKLINMYGITETTVHSTYKEITEEEIALGISNIGKPLPTLRLYLLDRYKRPVPEGVIGEIYVEGLGVARGYLNRPELTAERFLTPNHKTPPKKITQNKSFCGAFFKKRPIFYKSGDLGRFLSSGEMAYMGRMDHQVKIRGNRVETGEIQRQLIELNGIEDALVMVRRDNKGNNYLCAYVKTRLVGELIVPDLRKELQKRLPEYMIPSYFIPLPEFPITATGKLDRKNLPDPEGNRPETGAAYVEASTPTAQVIASIWQELLGLNRVGIHDNFFDLGGNSMRLIDLRNRLRETFGIDLSMAVLFEYPTIDGFARYVESQKKPASVPRSDERAEEKGPDISARLQKGRDKMKERRQRISK